MAMTRKQADLVTFLEKWEMTHRYSPTFEEMMKGLGLKSKSGVARLVNALEERGYIERFNFRRSGVKLANRLDPFTMKHFLKIYENEIDCLKAARIMRQNLVNIELKNNLR